MGITTRREPGPYIMAAGISRTVRLTTLAVPTAARPTALIDCTAAAETCEAAFMAMHPDKAKHAVRDNNSGAQLTRASFSLASRSRILQA